MNQIAYIKRTGIFSIRKNSSRKELLYGVAGSICYILYMVFLIVDENKSPDTLFAGTLIVVGGILGSVGLGKCVNGIIKEPDTFKKNLPAFAINLLVSIIFMVSVVSTTVIFVVFLIFGQPNNGI